MLISEDYLSKNTQLHENSRYGSRIRAKIYNEIKDLAKQTSSKTILDYGCGKGVMASHLAGVTSYDPCVPEFSKRPESTFDLVACCDVLEHVEPEYLDNVLDDIKQFADKAVFLVISTRLAAKTLPDGRNAHLIVEGLDWWKARLAQNFTFWQLTTTNTGISEITVLGTKHGSR